MLKLIVLRAAPLFLRPAAVLLEGTLKTNGYILVTVLPIAAMALTISSVPVHLDFFRSHVEHPDYQRHAKNYASALTLLTVLSTIILISILAIMPSGLNAIFITAICFTFISEKLADEISRSFEFRKAFVAWFSIQCLRSVWLFLPIIVSLLGAPYTQSFLVSAIMVTVCMLWLFVVVTRLKPQFSWHSTSLIKNNIIYLVGNLLPASYRQVPRIAVSRLFPEQAHIFLAVAQICQSVALIYGVKFQIPYRRIIARRPQMFQRRINFATMNIIFSVFAIIVVYLAASPFVRTENIVGVWLSVALMPLMIADSLMFGMLSTHLGFLQWFVSRYDALITYVLCLGVAGSILLGFIALGLFSGLTVLSIPIMTISIGMLWFFLVKYRHFPPR